MKIDKFEDILSWQKSKNLVVIVYKALHGNKDFGFKDQMQRAVVSISNNTAEGYERRSNKEFKQFLYIAKGSCGEVRSMTQIGVELGYLKEAESREIYSNSLEISKLISGLIKVL
ncbi:MAG: four helix bundle protein [Candidatus Paceibacterota bacterium]|jgi:four helix bundle protein